MKSILIGFCFALFIITDAVNIVSRSEWNARSPKITEPLRHSPAPYVVVHHGTGNSCSDRSSCAARVRSYQNSHMNERDFDDIGYSFLIGEDGNAYEGRGWNRKGSHEIKYNSKSIGICVIGDFSNHKPNQAALNALSELISLGVSSGKIKSDYKLIGHRQAKATACPGNKLYEHVKSMPHWITSP